MPVGHIKGAVGLYAWNRREVKKIINRCLKSSPCNWWKARWAIFHQTHCLYSLRGDMLFINVCAMRKDDQGSLWIIFCDHWSTSWPGGYKSLCFQSCQTALKFIANRLGCNIECERPLWELLPIVSHLSLEINEDRSLIKANTNLEPL